METNSPTISNHSETTPSPAANDKHELQIYLALTVAVFIILGVVVAHMILKNREQTAMAPEQQQATTLPLNQDKPLDMTKAWMKVSADSSSVTLGQSVSLTATGDSEGHAVTGFDVLLSFPNTLNLVSVKESNSSFQLFKGAEQKVGEYTILPLTFTLASEKNDGIIFKGDVLFTASFTAVSSGKTAITILPSLDNKTTKFVDSQVKVVIPQVQQAKITIQ